MRARAQQLRPGRQRQVRASVNDRRRVIILAYSYPPDGAVGGWRPYRFARHLPACGFEVHVVTASRQDRDAPANVHYTPDRMYMPGAWRKLARRVEARLPAVLLPSGG